MPTGVMWPITNTKALYHFEGNSNDATGAHNGTDADITYVAGKFGTSASFNGTSSRISAADSADWNFGTGDFTIMFWVTFTATPGSVRFLQQWEANNRQWMFRYLDGTSSLYFTNDDAGGTTINLAFTWSVPTLNKPYFIALTRISDVWRCYVDGVQLGADQTDADGISDYTGSLYIGAGNEDGAWSNGITGAMDELHILKGTGLTGKQVSNYYAWMTGKGSKIL